MEKSSAAKRFEHGCFERAWLPRDGKTFCIWSKKTYFKTQARELEVLVKGRKKSG
jgi:hypothetical protein